MGESKERLPQYGPELVAHVDRTVLDLQRKLALIADLLTSRERTIRQGFSGNTDGSGNGTAQVGLSVRAGQEFSLHRLIVDDEDYLLHKTYCGGFRGKFKYRNLRKEAKLLPYD